MKLPQGENALVELEKLTEYCLSPNHPRGRHKARVFRTVLAMSEADAQELRSWLLKAAVEGVAVPGMTDEYGARYTIDFEAARKARRATIRSAWLLSHEHGAPRLLTCFIL